MFDAHLHLQDPRLAGRAGDLVSAMRAVGITGCVVNGTSEDDWPAVADLARRFPGFVHPAFGLHPWHAARRSDRWLDTLNRFLDLFPDATIGECGVDRWIREPAIGLQKDVFLAQLRLAAQRTLPVSVHCLRAWGPLLDCIEACRPPAGFLLHSFGGTPELVIQLEPLGARFSFSGHILHPRKAACLASLRAVPDDLLLVETDAPDMPPPAEHIRIPLATADGNPLNHPANLPAIIVPLAVHLKQHPADFASRTTANARAFFGLAGPRE